jgi:hypothetical protein
VGETSVLDFGQLRNRSESDWYKRTFGLREASGEREEDSRRPFVDLRVSNDDTALTLVEREATSSAQSEHVIFFTRNL